MSRKIHWGRIGGALLLLSVAPWAVLPLLAPAAFWESPTPEPMLEDFKGMQAELASADRQVEIGSADKAIQRALVVWEHGHQMQVNAPFINVMIGSNYGLEASEVVQHGLASPELSNHARTNAEQRLRALARHRINLPEISAVERQEHWSWVRVSLMNLEPINALLHLREATRNDTMQQYAEGYQSLIARAEQSQKTAGGLAWMAALQLYDQEHGHCPDHVADLGRFPTEAPYTYDQQRCELAMVVHPTQGPKIFHAR